MIRTKNVTSIVGVDPVICGHHLGGSKYESRQMGNHHKDGDARDARAIHDPHPVYH